MQTSVKVVTRKAVRVAAYKKAVDAFVVELTEYRRQHDIAPESADEYMVLRAMEGVAQNTLREDQKQFRTLVCGPVTMFSESIAATRHELSETKEEMDHQQIYVNQARVALSKIEGWDAEEKLTKELRILFFYKSYERAMNERIRVLEEKYDDNAGFLLNDLIEIADLPPQRRSKSLKTAADRALNNVGLNSVSDELSKAHDIMREIKATIVASHENVTDYSDKWNKLSDEKKTWIANAKQCIETRTATFEEVHAGYVVALKKLNNNRSALLNKLVVFQDQICAKGAEELDEPSMTLNLELRSHKLDKSADDDDDDDTNGEIADGEKTGEGGETSEEESTGSRFGDGEANAGGGRCHELSR